MKQLFTVFRLFTLLSFLSTGRVHVQAGNAGIGTTTPGSKWTVDGSFALLAIE